MTERLSKNPPPSLAIFLATSGHSGVDRVMANFIRELSARGMPVDLLKIRAHGPYVSQDLPGLRIIKLPVSHVNSAILPLIRYLKTQQPPVLLTDKDRVNRVALLARQLSGVKTRIAIRVGTTVTVNLARRRWLHRKLQYFSIRHLYHKSDSIIVPSSGVAQDIIGISKRLAGLVQVVPSPIGTPALETLAQEPTGNPWVDSPDRPVVLGVGELCARKDFETLIRAFAIVTRKIPSRLIILGDGAKRNYLEHLADEIGLKGIVSMPGFIDNPYAYMKRASVFVLSSKCEGAPVVLMEALTVGVPVVSTDCPSGPREILQDGRIGPLVPVGDEKALARAIISVLDNPPDEKILKSAARPYSVKEATDAYLAALGLSKK